MQIWTVNEQDCYDKGFENAKDYWVPLEQERIIKLLDDWKCGHPDCDGDKTEVCYPKHYLIALIKGEESNNEEFSGTSISNHVAKQRRTIRRYP